MTVHWQAVIRCEHPGCPNTTTVESDHRHGVTIESGAARDRAQNEGWATRRNHAGIDLCPLHRAGRPVT